MQNQDRRGVPGTVGIKAGKRHAISDEIEGADKTVFEHFRVFAETGQPVGTRNHFGLESPARLVQHVVIKRIVGNLWPPGPDFPARQLRPTAKLWSVSSNRLASSPASSEAISVTIPQ